MNPNRLYKVEGVNEDQAGRDGILRTLTYFDIFHYPLTCDEIRQYHPAPIPERLFLECLRQLLVEKRVYFFNGYYSIQNNPFLESRRRLGNRRATELLKKATRIGRFLSCFPFVRGVGISGSLSKNYADEGSDLDFFIITRANRLWIARTLMHIYKKFTYLNGRQHHYCMNYYIDENAFELSDKNIFTAIELKTLLPVAGEKAVREFFGKNEWAEEFFPACEYRRQEKKDPSYGWMKAVAERLLGFNGLDDFLFRITQRRWKRKTVRRLKNAKGVVMGLVCDKHFARSNPEEFQEKVLRLFEEKMGVEG